MFDYAITAIILLPVLTALLVRALDDDRGERVALGGAVLTLVVSVGVVAHHLSGHLSETLDATRAPWSGEALFGIDPLSTALVPFYAAVVLLVIATTPRRLWSRHTTVSILLTEACVIALYTTRDLVAVALFWLLSGIPGLASLRQLDRDKSRPQPRARLVCGLPLTGSGLLVAVAVGMQVMQAQELGVSQPTSVAALQGLGTSKVVFALLMVAVLLRKGVIPFHSWLPPLFERGPLGLVMVLFNAHLGAFLVARVIIPVFGEMSAAAATVVTAIALLTAVYAAMVASAQSDPRRLLGFVSMSQASFLLVGLESFNHEGVAGALVLWISLGLASTAAVMAYRALEARAGRRTLKTYHGLAARMPRLAASFVIFGLAMAGLPGTLGFAAEDLLVHGVLESHPAIGVLLVLAAGLNAVNVLRMFMRMFLGRPLNQVAAYPDLSRREGWALALVLLFVVVTGILPHGMVLLREQAASSIAAHRPSMELAMERTTAEVPQ